MKDFEIKESNISGKGIFALRDFKKGELVIDWSKCSKIISREIFENLSENEKNFVQIRDNKYTYFSSPASCMNHSCNPNAESRYIGDFAIRDIRIGEEVTISYSGEDGDLGFVCNCGKCLRI